MKRNRVKYKTKREEGRERWSESRKDSAPVKETAAQQKSNHISHKRQTCLRTTGLSDKRTKKTNTNSGAELKKKKKKKTNPKPR